MGNLRAAFLLPCIMLLCAPLFVQAEEGGLEGSQTDGGIDQTPLEERCEPKGPYKEGEVCYFEEVSCLNGKKGLALSRCKAGNCVGTEACGIVLPTQSTEIPDGTTPPTGQEPVPVPGVGGIPNPIPSSPTPSISPGSGTGSGSGGAGGAGGGADPYTLPPVEVVQDPAPTVQPGTSAKPLPGWQGGSGSTFSTAPSVVSSGPSGGFGDGVYSGGNPFTNPSGTTFTGSWGASSGASGNLFSSFLSGIGNLISGLFGGGGTALGGSSSSVQPSQPSGSQPPFVEPATMTPEEFEKLLGPVPVTSPLDMPLPKDPRSGFPIVPTQSQDRTGLPAPGLPPIDSGFSPLGPLFPSGIENPDVWEGPTPPTAPTPSGGKSLVDNSDGVMSDAPQITRTVEDVIAGLLDGTVAENSELVKAARDGLEAEIERTKAIVEEKGGWLDSQSWLPAFVKSSDYQAWIDARARLSALGFAEGMAGLRANAQGIAPPATSNLALQNLADNYNSLSQRVADAKREAGWRGAIERFLLPDSMESQDIFDIKRMEDTLSGMEDRLAALARERGVGLTYSSSGGPWRVAIDALPPQEVIAVDTGSGVTLPDVPPTTIPIDTNPPSIPTTFPQQIDTSAQPPAVPTAPVVPPAVTPLQPPSAPSQPSGAPSQVPTPTAGNSTSGSGFVQGSIKFLGGLLQNLLGFFTGSSSNGDSSQIPQSAEPNPAASITANPSLVNDGDTTVLAWSSVRASNCALVDAALNIIAEGEQGTSVSPALSESTRYGVICDIEGGADKFVNETIVRVRGDETDPAPIFSHSGSVSNASGAGVSISASESTSGSASEGGNANVTPVDVRTCDPEQSIDSFIRCLCEAEPNSAGCSIPPGGL